MVRKSTTGEVRVGAAVAMVFALLLAATAQGVELPPEIQVDRLLVQADRESREGNHWSAVLTLDRALEAMEEHGVEIPPAFWFRQASAFQNAGMHERTVEASSRYLTETGRGGQHYQAALELLDAAEAGLAEARWEAAQTEAAAERAAREAEARRAAIARSAPQMVVVPAGTFRMGCVVGRGHHCRSSEWPTREVRIESFELSKHEVTFAQWDACVQHGSCRWVEDDGWGRNDRPVINVTWDDAQAYAAWLSKEMGESYRLPSEAEWEYAARAGTETVYSWGNERGRGLANCDGCRCADCGVRTSPVGSYPQNAFGLHDMHGNVKEWVLDCMADNYVGAATDGGAWKNGDCSSRRLRGGSWGSKGNDIRSATRWSRSTNFRDQFTGFRIARSLEGQQGRDAGSNSDSGRH